MTSGFCTLESVNVAASIDRRCPNDNSLVIAPSTLCAHRQWMAEGGWSECLQERPCPPRAADEWRKMLDQQAAAVKKRDKDRAARQFSAAHGARPKLATAHKGRRISFKAEPSQIIPALCSEHLQDIRNGRPKHRACQACQRRARRRMMKVAS